MKKAIFISMGFIAISVCNAYADCIEWGDAKYFYSTEAQLKAACTASSWLGARDCATLDMNLTFVSKFDDGSCEYVPSCASCPSGYAMSEDVNEYKVGEVCYLGNDSKIVNGYNQSMLDKWMFESYTCESTAACADGYYGALGASNCTQCPTATTIYTNSARTTLARGTSTSGNNTAVHDCFLAPGTYYDVTGTFKITSAGSCLY